METIEARVIQKIATPAQWRTISYTPYKGEILIVGDASGKVTNIKVGDGSNDFDGLEYMFDSIQQNANYIPVSGYALPTPESDSGFTMLVSGDYTFGGNPAFTVTEGNFGIASWDGSSWSLLSMVELPVDPNGVKYSDIDVPGGVTGFDTFSEVTIVDTSGANVADIDSAEYGLFSSFNGNPQSSSSWLRIPYSAIPEDVKGTNVTVTRDSAGNLPEGANLVSFRDSNGDYMASASVQGYNNFAKQTVVFVPENANTWAFTIRNVAGVEDPVNNQYTQGFSVVSEEVESVLLDETKINNPDNIVFSNPITEDGDGAVPAKEIYGISQQINSISEQSGNMADMSQGVVSGFWLTSGGHSSSNNWIKKEPIQFSDDIVSRLENNEELYLWIFGGGTVGSGGASVVFWDEEDTLVYSQPGTGGSTFPLRVEIPSEARSIGVTIANSVGIGLDPLNNPYVNTFYIGLETEENTQPEYQSYGYVIKPSAIPNLPNIGIDTREVIIRKVSDILFHIYYHIGGPDNLWFRINLIHQISESKFVDLWRIENGRIFERVGDEFTGVRTIITSGVYENAIYINGYSDALGSSHGWELFDDFRLWMDGTEIDILDSNFTEARGIDLNFNQLSTLKTVDGTGDVGRVFKKWRFKDSILNIDMTFTWLQNLTVAANGRSFTAMLSILRSDSNGNITHSAQSNDDGTVYDVSQPGFETPINTDRFNPLRNYFNIWGDEFKAELEVSRTIIKNDGTTNYIGFSNGGGFVQNSELYNKLYLMFGTDNISPGDVWVSNATYRMLNKMGD